MNEQMEYSVLYIKSTHKMNASFIFSLLYAMRITVLSEESASKAVVVVLVNAPVIFSQYQL